MVVACATSKPYKTFADVVAAARAKPEVLTFATIGNGSLGHLGMTLLEKTGNFSLTHVPYNGGGPAVNSALGGQVELIIGSAALLAQQITSGALRPLLQTGKARLPNLAETQTAIEAGFADFVALSWWGVFAPAGLPAQIRDRMNREIAAIVATPDFAQFLKNFGATPVSSSPAEFQVVLAREVERWKHIAQRAGIHMQ